MHMELAEWRSRWDTWIAAWVAAGGEPDTEPELAALRARWLGRKRVRDAISALPEPYVGDPRDEALLGVVLAHNPGPAVPNQRVPDGRLPRLIADGHRWSDLARTWDVAPETVRWWGGMADALRTMLDEPQVEGLPKIFGIDLLPWHSEKRIPLSPDAASAAWLRHAVLTPALRIAERARLRIRTPRGDRPLVVAVHEHVWLALDTLGARELVRLDPRMPAQNEVFAALWPRNAEGELAARHFDLRCLALQGGEELLVLATWSEGGYLQPGRDFREVMRWLLERALV